MITVENHVMKSSGVDELLGATIDSNLNFEGHILSLCKKANPNNTYNLRRGMHLSRVNVHSTQYGTESIGNLGAKIWNLVPVHMKDLKALSKFKNQIKKWILYGLSMSSV